MGSEFRVRHLSKGDILRAFPLIQAVRSDITVENWSRFAMLQIDGVGTRTFRSGIVAVERENGYLYGMFTYNVVDVALVGRGLVCDHFVVLDLLSSDEPLTVLIKASEKLAKENRCSQVQLCIPTPWTTPDISTSPIVKLLYQSGFDCESLRFHGVGSHDATDVCRQTIHSDPEVTR
jgi:hypothetical protein